MVALHDVVEGAGVHKFHKPAIQRVEGDGASFPRFGRRIAPCTPVCGVDGFDDVFKRVDPDAAAGEKEGAGWGRATKHSHDLPPAAEAAGVGLSVRVVAIRGEEVRQTPSALAGRKKTGQPLIVEKPPQVGAERADFAEHGTLQEKRGLADVVVRKIETVARAVFREKIRREDAAVLIDFERVAVNEIKRGICGERRDDVGEGAGKIGVVGIEPRDDFAAGERETLVDGVRLALVFLAHPRDPIAVAFENLGRVVGGHRVHDDDFHLRDALVENAAQRGFDPAPMVVGGHHDTEARGVHGVTCA